MRSDTVADLALTDPEAGGIVHRFGIDRSGPTPVLDCPEEFVRDYLAVPGPDLPDWPTKLVRAALSARARPLPTGPTMAWLVFDCRSRLSAAWELKERTAGRDPAHARPEPPSGDRPVRPHLLTFESVLALSRSEAVVVVVDDAGERVRWRFTADRSGTIHVIHSPEEYSAVYQRVPGPVTPEWPGRLASEAMAAFDCPLPAGAELESRREGHRSWQRGRWDAGDGTG
ncbi:hypothetical protein [Kitasatospora sp. NPDC090091]|uniref:hypothetical protein n=1 Tax=Kitasatospora sp. NPDC090091 TaxID=3364081 RepID=UPI0037FFBFDE